LRHLAKIAASRLFLNMRLWPLLLLFVATPAMAQRANSLVDKPDQLKRYTECMALARNEPLKALPSAEKWMAEGGGLGARHCVAVAMFAAGRYANAATQFETIARDMGGDRPGLRAELWAQAGQAWMEAGGAEKAIAAQSQAIALNPNDAELYLDRGLAHAAVRAWPSAVKDFDRAQQLRPADVEILILRAAAWRNSGDAGKALADAQRALGLAPDHSEALLERGFAQLARGDKLAANNDFNRVLKLVPPDSDAGRRAAAGLRGEMPKAMGDQPATRGK
jgi:tetratricopeptide (TPR) repeat protein